MPDSEYDPDPRWAPGQGLGKYLTNTGEDMWDLIQKTGEWLDKGGGATRSAQAADARSKMAAIANAVLPEAVSKFPSNVANIASTAVNDPSRFGRAAAAFGLEPLSAANRLIGRAANHTLLTDPDATMGDAMSVAPLGMMRYPAALRPPVPLPQGAPVAQSMPPASMSGPGPMQGQAPSLPPTPANMPGTASAPSGAFGPAPASSPISASAPPPISADINPTGLAPQQFGTRYIKGNGLDTGAGPTLAPPQTSSLSQLSRGGPPTGYGSGIGLGPNDQVLLKPAAPTIPASDTSRIGVTQGARGAPIGRDLRTGKFISASDPRVKSQIQRMQAAAMQTATTPEEEK